MKKFLLLTLTCIILFGACTPRVEMPADPRDSIMKLLTGTGNKRWFLRKSYLNNVQQTLTDYQLKYWKDYTINPAQPYMGVWADENGWEGKWRMPNTQEIPETVTNNTAAVIKNYVINSITATELDIEYTANLVTTREVYHAN
ncbi:MAG: hypothetical protein ABI581_08330 [Sediminibacterium sp.]